MGYETSEQFFIQKKWNKRKKKQQKQIRGGNHTNEKSRYSLVQVVSASAVRSSNGVGAQVSGVGVQRPVIRELLSFEEQRQMGERRLEALAAEPLGQRFLLPKKVAIWSLIETSLTAKNGS